MNKLVKIGVIGLASLSLVACGNSVSSSKKNSDDSYKRETQLQLSKKYTSKIAEKQEKGEKLTAKEKAIVNAHRKQMTKELDATKAKFEGNTAVFPTRGTIKIEAVAEVPTYTDDGTVAKKQAIVVKAKITNTSKKTLDTDHIQVGNNEKANLWLTAWQNSDSTKEDLSDDNEVDGNDLSGDSDLGDEKIAESSLLFKSPKILPGKSVTLIYDAFYLVSDKNPIVFKIQDGTGMSNANDVVEKKSTLRIPLSEIKSTTLTELFSESTDSSSSASQSSTASSAVSSSSSSAESVSTAAISNSSQAVAAAKAKYGDHNGDWKWGCMYSSDGDYFVKAISKSSKTMTGTAMSVIVHSDGSMTKQ